MATQEENLIPGLSQIVKEEAHLAYGIQRVLLAVISIGLLIGSLYCFIAPDMVTVRTGKFLSSGQIFGSVLMFFSAAFAFGSWWANRIYTKLANLKNSTVDTSK